MNLDVPRQRPDTPTSQVTFRLPDPLIAEIDALADELSEAASGVKVARVEALKVILNAGLVAMGKRKAPAKPRRG